MIKQLELLDKPPRRAPRVLMHVTDAGDRYIQFTCRTCGHRESRYGDFGTVTENKRGLPCPMCNGAAS